jgi:hypothetical protein
VKDFSCTCLGSILSDPISNMGSFIMFCLACFEFHSWPPHSNTVRDDGSDHCHVYPIHNVRSQSPGLTKHASACLKSLLGFINNLSQLPFPCQSLV